MTPEICRHCGSSLVIEEDGIDVCWSCVVILTTLADDPSRGTDWMLGALVEKHSDTVRLTGDPLRWERITPTRYYSGDRG